MKIPLFLNHSFHDTTWKFSLCLGVSDHFLNKHRSSMLFLVLTIQFSGDCPSLGPPFLVNPYSLSRATKIAPPPLQHTKSNNLAFLVRHAKWLSSLYSWHLFIAVISSCSVVRFFSSLSLVMLWVEAVLYAENLEKHRHIEGDTSRWSWFYLE